MRSAISATRKSFIARSTASTLINAERVVIEGISRLRFDEDLVELQLDHLTKDRVARIYNRGDCWPDRAALMQHWADMLDALRDGATVIPLKGAA